MAKKTCLINNGTELFPVTSGITTLSYNVAYRSSLATVINDRYIIKAGTPVPANDATCVGLCFENYDVTDEGGQIPILIGGFVNEFYSPVIYASACKTALDGVHFLNVTDYPVPVSIAVVSSGDASDFVAGTTLVTLTITLTGGLFVQAEAAKAVNWIVSGLPDGFAVSAVACSSTTSATITISSSSSAVADIADKISVSATESCIANSEGSVPPEVLVNLFVA
jgi:hypothetical protein